jgi:hypothetical protein
MNRIKETGKFFKKNLEEICLVGTLAELSIKDAQALSGDDEILLEAVRRSTNNLSSDSSNKDVLSYLANYEEEQIPGLVSNIKGIAHELYFAQAENEDGDNITAELYEDTNHEGYDVKLINESTGEVSEIQLKATDNKNYVTDWIDNHDGNILVTKEIADKMGIESTGISNEKITVDTEDFISHAIKMNEESLSDSIPALSMVSVSLIIFALYKKYSRKEISLATFKAKALVFSSKKLLKIGTLTLLLSIPAIGQATGAYLVYSVLQDGKKLMP